MRLDVLVPAVRAPELGKEKHVYCEAKYSNLRLHKLVMICVG
jgi:hypothetical protein